MPARGGAYRHDVMATIECLAQDLAANHLCGTEKSHLAIDFSLTLPSDSVI
jgi:hypothetical protein